MEKVLFIRRPGAFGGIEVLLLDWLKDIDYDKNRVFLASTMDCFGDAIRIDRLPVDYDIAALPTLGSFMSVYRSWSRDIRKFSPDKIVILEGMIDEVPPAAVLAAYVAARGNVYMTEHLAWPFPPEKTRSIHFGFLPGAGLWWHRMMWGIRVRGYLSKRILAVSEAVRNVLLMYGYPGEKIAIAFHGVDVSRYSPSEAIRAGWRREHGVPEDAVVWISTARLAKEKRLDRLLNAFGALSRKHGNLWLLLAGEGPTRKELERLADSLGVRERVMFLGLADNVPELLQASDLFVLPSDREGLSVSLTEAMSTGLVCIASNVSGSNEVIRDGENGFLVDPSDEGVLNGIGKALTLDGPARTRIARNARNTIVEKFEKRRSVKNILDLLDIESRQNHR
ncbi:MAG: glycosyltransferase [Deltaproteobacteria bacterium]|nr:glycosyltransferase [Candidatus Deferrimicrobiaceae bacterium]